MTTNQIPYLERLRDELVTSVAPESRRAESRSARPSRGPRWTFGPGARKLGTIVVALAVAVAAIVVTVRAFHQAEQRVPLSPATPSLRWVRDIQGAPDAATGVAADASGVYVTGSAAHALPGQTKGGMFVRKYDLDGNELWTQQFGGDAGSIAVDPTGVYVSGGTWLRKLDANGGQIWRYAIPDAPTSNTDGDPLAVDATGVYVAACGSVRKLDTDGNELWTVDGPCGRADLAIDATGLYTVTVTGPRFETDITLRRYSLDGGSLWTRTLPRVRGDGLWTFAYIATDGQGVEVLSSSPACRSQANTRPPSCLVLYDGAGSLVATTPVDPGFDFFAGDMLASSDGLIVTGQGIDDTNTFIGFLASDGEISRTVALEGNRWPSGVTSDGTDVYVAGVSVDGRARSRFVARIDISAGSG